jgi:hypothetical protein
MPQDQRPLAARSAGVELTGELRDDIPAPVGGGRRERAGERGLDRVGTFWQRRSPIVANGLRSCRRFVPFRDIS